MKFNISSRFTFTRRAKIIWATLIALAVLLALFGWINAPAVPSSVPQAANSSPKPFVPVKKDLSANGSVDTSTPAPASIPALPYRQLGGLSDLRGQLEEEKIITLIKDQKAKQASLDAKPSPPQIHAPAPSMPTLSLPDLTPSSQGRQVTLPPARSGTGAGMGVISVQGVGNSISATIRSGSGQIVVRPGSKLGDAVVTSISREAVSIRRAGKVSSLPFVE